MIEYIWVDGEMRPVHDPNAVPQTRKVCNKALTSDLNLTLSDIGEEVATDAQVDAIFA